MKSCRLTKTGTPSDLIKWLLEQDREAVFDITEHRNKRSLNANAYAWVLITEIANVLRASKDEIYLQMLKRYGQSDMISVVSSVNVAPYFKYYDKVGETELQGKLFYHYRIYKGSSEFDTREMAILIDGIISEAKLLEIETLPPLEVERLKAKWG